MFTQHSVFARHNKRTSAVYPSWLVNNNLYLELRRQRRHSLGWRKHQQQPNKFYKQNITFQTWRWWGEREGETNEAAERRSGEGVRPTGGRARAVRMLWPVSQSVGLRLRSLSSSRSAAQPPSVLSLSHVSWCQVRASPLTNRQGDAMTLSWTVKGVQLSDFSDFCLSSQSVAGLGQDRGSLSMIDI